MPVLATITTHYNKDGNEKKTKEKKNTNFGARDDKYTARKKET